MLADHLHRLIAEHHIDLVVCNAENVAGGSGLTPQLFQKLLRYGVDVVTLGDHCFRKSEIIKDLKVNDHVLRPANLTAKAPGRRWTIVATKSGEHQVAVTCLLGQMFMGHYQSPWPAADEVLAEMGHRVRCVPNGVSAREALRSDAAVDLLLTDWVMPSLEGPKTWTATGARPSRPAWSGCASPSTTSARPSRAAKT